MFSHTHLQQSWSQLRESSVWYLLIVYVHVNHLCRRGPWKVMLLWRHLTSPLHFLRIRTSQVWGQLFNKNSNNGHSITLSRYKPHWYDSQHYPTHKTPPIHSLAGQRMTNHKVIQFISWLVKKNMFLWICIKLCVKCTSVWFFSTTDCNETWECRFHHSPEERTLLHL